MSLKLCCIKPDRGVSSKLGGVLLIIAEGSNCARDTEVFVVLILRRRTVPELEGSETEAWSNWAWDRACEADELTDLQSD